MSNVSDGSIADYMNIIILLTDLASVAASFTFLDIEIRCINTIECHPSIINLNPVQTFVKNTSRLMEETHVTSIILLMCSISHGV